MRRYCIIGNGPAGINAIEAIRKADREGEVINICAEPYLPYSRPLLPFFIGGSIPEERVYFRPPSFYQDYDVIPVLGEKVIDIDPEKGSVVLASGRRIGYDRLLIATGGTPSKPKIEGVELKNVFYLNMFDYAKEIVKAIPNTKRALILGGGPLGLKAGLALSHHPIEVKIVISSPQVMSRVLDPDSAAVIQKKLEESGIEVLLRNDVVALSGKEKVEEATLKNGERLKCDLIIIAKGVRPNFNFLATTRAIRVNVGVIVNQYLRTTVEDVYAAGDVAECYDILSGRSNVVAVWPRASEQGYYAGLNMAGFPKEYVGAHRMNSLDFEGLSCIVMGDVRSKGEGYKTIIQRNLKEGVYQKVVLENGSIRGASIIGRVVNVGGINRFIRNRLNIEPFKSGLLEERSTFIY